MPLTFEKVAILGATGPTGRVLAAELRRRGVPVRAVARRMEGLEAAFPEAETEKVRGDALDLGSLRAAIAGCDCVVDCLGLPADQMTDHPKTARNIAAAVAATGARCLQVSSYWCYMPIVRLPVSEDHPRAGGPPWARLRREPEDILREAGAAIVHLPDFFGPHVHTSTLQLPLRDAVAGKPMNWIGGAEVERDYIYVPDAMRIVADLMTRERAYGEDWIAPGSGPVSATRVAAILSGILGHTVKIRAAGQLALRLVSLFNRDLRGFMQLAPTYVKPIRFDGTKLEGLIGAIPRASYEDALAETVRSIAEGG
jgi:nucleoside-diphosphate-sugar epimerase